jgi:hypothetical protein
MKVIAALLIPLAILAAGCGSDDDSASPPATTAVTTSGATTELSPDDVEEAFGAEVAGGGVVNLDDSPPKSIECEKGDAFEEWRCRIFLSGGDSRVCVITVDPATRTVTQRTCGRIDN